MENNMEPSGGQANAQKATMQSVKQFGQMAMPDGSVPFHCLTIIGQIEGHMVLPPRNKTTKYEHIIPQLVAIEQNPKIKGLMIILNTVGGDIEAGLAIAEMIKTMSKPTVSLVLGGGHSIGAPIAVAADHSFIAETATMTIHPIRLTGLVIGVPQTYDYLDKMQDRVIRFIVDNSRVSQNNLREMMFRTGELVRDVGTVLIGEEAARVGLIDEVGGLSHATNKLYQLIAVQSQPNSYNQSYGYQPGYQQPFQPVYQQPYQQPYQQLNQQLNQQPYPHQDAPGYQQVMAPGHSLQLEHPGGI